MDLRSKKIVYGYIHALPNSFSNTIPIELINLILNLYHPKLMFAHKYQSAGLHLINDNRMRRLKCVNINAMFSFADGISNVECNLFQIHIKWNVCKRDIFIGYICNLNDIRWNTYVGDRINENSTGLYITKNQTKIFFIDTNNYLTPLENKADTPFGQDGIFILSFDFVNDQMTVKHNNKTIGTISLKNHKEIIPAFSLSSEGEEIEVVQYSFG
eukprot:532935_1